MFSRTFSRRARPRRVFAAAVLALGASLPLVPAAQARVFLGVGFGFGFPVFGPYYPFYVPPVVVAPPVIHGSPYGAYGPYGPHGSPAAYAHAPPGHAVAPRCFAGAYICPLDRPGVVGGPCSCPTNTGRAPGRVG